MSNLFVIWISLSIFYDFKTNICTWDIPAQVKKSLGYLIIFRDYHSYTMEILAQQYGNFLLRLRKQCWMIGVEFSLRNKGIKGTLPSTFQTRPT